MRSASEITNYIYWQREATPEVLSAWDWHKKYLEVKKAGERVKVLTKRFEYYRIADRNKIAYKVVVKGKYRNLYTFDYENKYKWYTTNDFDTSKAGKTGTEAIKKFNAEFAIENNSTDIRLFRKTYGTTDERFKNCVPKQFYWIDHSLCDQLLCGVSSVDDTAHYPAHACGAMPDSNTQILREGQVEPNSEYPFAFYLNSGHFAEYKGVDTRTWINSPFLTSLFDFKAENKKPFLPANQDITVLMKPAKYTMDSTWKKLYEMRKIDPDAKLAMNATIGNWHRRSYRSYKYAHLAAVVIARANAKMLAAVDLLGKDKIIHICVDGIIYFGGQAAQENKEFGEFVQEFTNCKFKMRGMNTYIAMHDNNIIKYKHGAYNYNSDDSLIEEKPPITFNDMYQWKRIDLLKNDV